MSLTSSPPSSPDTDVERIADAMAALTRAAHRLKEQAARRLDRKYRDDASPAVRWGEFAPLGALTCRGPLRVTDLADALHLSASTTSRVAAHLIEAGLVERTADAVDGRASLLVVTPAGRRRHADMTRLRDEAVAGALRAWPDHDLHSLAVLLPRLVDDLGLAGPPPTAAHDAPAHPTHEQGIS